jgi:tRNA (guanine37-N1)-methyltransferase
MVLKPEPFFRAIDAIRAARGEPGAIVLTSPQGRLFTQAEARRLRGLGHVVMLCGRYEGVDERVREHLATDEISIGDYVLTGGELPALVMADAIARFVPGVVGDEQSVALDSLARGRLSHPQYTRPAEFRGLEVPAVLLSGHHAEIERWRRESALVRTLARRPDLLDEEALDEIDRRTLAELRRSAGAREGTRNDD